MIYLDDGMRGLIDNARAGGGPGISGMASRDRRPQISMQDSVVVFDRERLAYWERAKRSALRNAADRRVQREWRQ